MKSYVYNLIVAIVLEVTLIKLVKNTEVSIKFNKVNKKPPFSNKPKKSIDKDTLIIMTFLLVVSTIDPKHMFEDQLSNSSL